MLGKFYRAPTWAVQLKEGQQRPTVKNRDGPLGLSGPLGPYRTLKDFKGPYRAF